LRRFRHALAQLRDHLARVRECPEGALPHLFGDVYLTSDFMTGHRKVVDSLEHELRQMGSTGNMMVNSAYDDIYSY
jgi:hypothetical protein